MSSAPKGNQTVRSLRSLSAKAIDRLPTPLVGILGTALGGVFLIPNPWVGAILWLAVLQQLQAAALAVLGVVIAEVMLRACRIADTSPVHGGLKANALLAALAAAWLTHPAGLGVGPEVQVLVAGLTALLAAFATAAVMRALSGSELPPLVVGYCAVASMLFAIFPNWTHSASLAVAWWPVPDDLIGWAATFFRTLGALLFNPTLGVGVILAGVILLWSRLAFLAGLAGWIAGIAVAVGLGELGVVYYWMPTAYNYFLAGMGLGAVFFLPGRASLAAAALAGICASLIAVALQKLFPYTAFGYLPIASTLTIWIGISALGQMTGQPQPRRNPTTDLTPERAWWQASYWRQRLGGEGPLLVVPLPGVVRISQGADGRLSHIGPWRHALDFERPVPDEGAGDAPRATIWNAPVIAPAGGTVERVRDGVPDNRLGVCNYADNWGNYVVIRLDQGSWAFLAHLRQGSVAVQPGQRVEIGRQLGTVGNSGRSPVPHLHLQVQSSPEPGAPTVPFRIANYLSTLDPGQPLRTWTAAAMPSEAALLSLATSTPAAHEVLASFAPGRALWTREVKGRLPGMGVGRPADHAATARITVSLDEAGRHVLRDAGGGSLVTSLDPDAWRVVELEEKGAGLLTLLALAVPSVPYAVREELVWGDLTLLRPYRRLGLLGLSLAPFLREPFTGAFCRCTALPGGQGGLLTVETRLEGAASWLPQTLICQFDRLRGPVRLEAQFDGGTLVYAQASFDPAWPSGGRTA